MGITELETSDKITWTDFLYKIQFHDIYYTPEYLRICELNNEGKGKCIIFQEEEKVVVYPFLLNQLDNSYSDIQSAYGYGGLLTNSHCQDFINSFIDAFNFWCESNHVIAEFVRFHPILNNAEILKDKMDVEFNRETVYLELDLDLDRIWLNFSSKCRNSIRKAINNGFSVERMRPTNENILSFYSLYTETMKVLNAHQYYFFSASYFRNLFFSLKGKIKLYGIYEKDELISAAIFLYSGKIVNYHLSARKASRNLAGLTNLILYTAIMEAKKDDYAIFHLGGGNRNNDGLHKFKLSFSKLTGRFFIGKKVHNENKYNDEIIKWEQKNENVKNSFGNYFLKYRIDC
ncbi:MAG: GNAT family N-acetyltransferase [Vicingaceae bacterium]